MHDGEAEGDEDVGSHEESDGGEGDLERYERAFCLGIAGQLLITTKDR